MLLKAALYGGRFLVTDEEDDGSIVHRWEKVCGGRARTLVRNAAHAHSLYHFSAHVQEMRAPSHLDANPVMHTTLRTDFSFHRLHGARRVQDDEARGRPHFLSPYAYHR